MAQVLVGIDGSHYSFEALRLAAQEARCRSAALHIMYVYEPAGAAQASVAALVMAADTSKTFPTDEAVMRQATARDEKDRAEQHRRAEGLLRQYINEADVDLSGIDVQRTAISDRRPSAALIRQSRNADLLVVGSRGRGGFAGLLLGSVSQQCVHHAMCPVLVVRG
jgi:nucleotide-binding universal stress UspA family protein